MRAPWQRDCSKQQMHGLALCRHAAFMLHMHSSQQLQCGSRSVRLFKLMPMGQQRSD